MSHFTEMATFRKPPPSVMHCMEAVYILLNGDKPPDWRTCQNMLRRQNFLSNILCLDIDRVDDTTMKRLEPYMNSVELDPHEMAKKSLAASGFCKWVHAVYNYQLMKKAT